MIWRISVTILGYRTNIYNFYIILVVLCLNSLHHIFSSSDIDLKSLFRIIVRCRRHHSSHMQNIVRTRNTLQDILITDEISPYYLHRRIREILFKHLTILLAVACKKSDIESVVSLI